MIQSLFTGCGMSGCGAIFAYLLENTFFVEKKGLKEEFDACYTFDELCLFHECHKGREEYRELFKEKGDSLLLYFYKKACQNSANHLRCIQKLQALFGPFWAEEIIDYALTSRPEEVSRLIEFCKKADSWLFIRPEKKTELSYKIKNDELTTCEELFDLFEVLQVQYDTHSTSITSIIEAILEKTFSENRLLFITLISKSCFKNIWKHIKSRKSNLPDKILIFIQNSACNKQTNHNKFSKCFNEKFLNEVHCEATEIMHKISSDPVLVLPKTEINSIDCIHVEGVCTGLVHDMAKQILTFWHDDFFHDNLSSFVHKQQKTASKEVYLTHLAYAKIHQVEFQWRGLLRQVHSQLESASYEMQACAFLMLCKAYNISEEKIVNFIKDNNSKLIDSFIFILKDHINKLVFSAIGDLKQRGIINEKAFTELAVELGIKEAKEQALIKEVVLGFYYARKLFGRRYTDHHFSEMMGNNKSTVMKLYHGALATRDDIKSYSQPVFSSLYHSSGHVLEEFNTHDAVDDFVRWKQWVEEASDGVYQFVLPGHQICLIKYDQEVYILDPNCPLIDQALVHFSISDKGMRVANYNNLTKLYPQSQKQPWQFNKILKHC